MSRKLDLTVRQELIDIFEYAAVDDMHMAAASQRFLEDYNQTVDLRELLEFLSKDLGQWLDVHGKLLDHLALHEPIDVNLGKALHATQFHLLTSELGLACSSSVGLRFITAIASKKPKILSLTMVDPCYLVRLASYENRYAAKDEVKRRLRDDPYFREIAPEEIRDMGTDFYELTTTRTCGCSADDISDFIHHRYDRELLELPLIANEFEYRMRYYGYLNFGTQPLPAPAEDYEFRGIIDYLKGPIPDQYVVNFAGHGINSYSLNFRYALGDLAVLIQVAYGGGYGNKEEDAKNWNDCMDQVGEVMLLNPENRKEGIRKRKYLLLYSNFRPNSRGGNLQLFAKRGNTWTELPLVQSWHDAQVFLSFL
jgi:hypothetical protein